jgi:predicted alpha-1,6-mannanase (GH76 family)
MTMPHSFLKITCTLLLSVSLASCLKEPVDEGPGPGAGNKAYVFNWTQIADSSYTSLISNFYNQPGKYYNENNSGKADFHYWRNAHALDVLVDAYVRKNDPQIKTRMDELLDGMKAKNGNTYINHFYDDMEWMALACLRAYEATSDVKYKTVAEQVWTDIKGGWDDTWGGGFYWNKERKNKNTPANAPACIIASRMYHRTLLILNGLRRVTSGRKPISWTLCPALYGMGWMGTVRTRTGSSLTTRVFISVQGLSCIRSREKRCISMMRLKRRIIHSRVILRRAIL